MVVYRRGVEVVSQEVDKYELASEPSILDLFEEGVIEPRYISTRLVLDRTLSAIRVSGLVTKHNVELDKVEVVPGSKVVEHH